MMSQNLNISSMILCRFLLLQFGNLLAVDELVEGWWPVITVSIRSKLCTLFFLWCYALVK